MKTAKIISVTLAFLMMSSHAFAQGYMSVNLGAQAKFTYVQIIPVPSAEGHILVQNDVTARVQHEVQSVSGQKRLIIN